MPRQKKDIFKQVESLINQDQHDEYRQVQLEAAAQIDVDEAGNKTVYAGIQINVPGYDMPIFIAVGELRSLADASEKYISGLMSGKPQEAKPKKSKAKKS